MKFTFQKKTLLYIIAISVYCGCAVQSDSIKRDHDLENTEIDFVSFFSIGNAGSSQKSKKKTYIKAMKDYLTKNATKNDYLFFLGDNVASNDLKKNLNKTQVDQLISITAMFKGTPLFIPGDREWNGGSQEKLEKIEDYIKDEIKNKEPFLPENGCPLKTISINDQIELILIDTQWYIEDWSKVKGMNDKCQLKTRSQFLTALKDEVRKARHKTVIIAMHHPVLSNGVYGGEIPLNAIYKPISENGFIPFLGLSWSFLRSQGGLSKQDLLNPLMNKLMTEMKVIAKQADRLIILSAHERSLQYIEHKNLKQVITGTANKKKSSRLSKNGLFSSSKTGFSEVRIYKDGSSSIHFFEVSPQGIINPLYENSVFNSPKKYTVDSLPTVFPKTFTTTIYPEEDVKVSKSYEKRWGKHYRYTYGVPVEAPVAILDTLYGGLKVERAGGGNQTLSLRLIDKNDKEYNMRALAKDPIAFLKSSGYDNIDANAFFNGTLPAALIKDFYTAAHPYGAFAIPQLARAVNLNHTQPKLFYVPKQKALGNFNKEHGDKLYMIVEKPDGDFAQSPMFDFSKEVESTSDLFKELREDEKYRLNEKEYIRARIFDFLLGDWDRHEDQWRWAQSAEDDKSETIIYTPVPRDRDQVFANFDGNYLGFFQKFISGTRELGKYGSDISFIKGFSRSAINLDRALLQTSTREDWMDEVAYIQKQITSELVMSAFSEMPKEVQDETWLSIQESLLSRKRNLKNIISRYYNHFTKFQTLKGTDKDDHFIITRLSDGATKIEAYRIKDGKDGFELFNRVFTSETEEIWVYGLDDNDVFDVRGQGKSNTKIVLIGGLDKDTFDVQNGHRLKVFDQKISETEIKNRSSASFKINDLYENHIYDSEREPSTRGISGLSLTYNPDEGMVPYIKFGKENLGYDQHPFSSKYLVEARYISLTQAAVAKASYHIGNIFPEWHLKVSGKGTTANYTENFFGFGNNSDYDTNTTFNINRVTIQRLQTGSSLYYNGEYGSSALVGITYENIKLRSPIQNQSGTSYLTTKGIYKYHSVDNKKYITRGLDFEIEGAYSSDLESNTTITSVNPNLTFWNAIDRKRRLVLKTSIIGQVRLEDNVPFYQAARLGGHSGLRSYRQHRFTGDQAASFSLDFSYKLKSIKTNLFPLDIQLSAGGDTGRVWAKSNNTINKNWHYSYGGGLQIGMTEALKGSATCFFGPEGGRLAFGFYFGL